MNCLSSQKCGTAENEAQQVGVWVYVVVGICIFGGMFGTLIGLFFLHSRQREKEREKRNQYWREQVSYTYICIVIHKLIKLPLYLLMSNRMLSVKTFSRCETLLELHSFRFRWARIRMEPTARGARFTVVMVFRQRTQTYRCSRTRAQREVGFAISSIARKTTRALSPCVSERMMAQDTVVPGRFKITSWTIRQVFGVL